MDYVPLNFELMKSPVNWVTVVLMIWLAGLMLALLMNPPFKSA